MRHIVTLRLRRTFPSPFLGVLVGPEEAKWVVGQDIFTELSGFWKSECANLNFDPLVRTVRLHDIYEEVFTAYNQWACHGMIETPDRPTEEVVAEHPEIDGSTELLAFSRWSALVKLYSVAHLLGDIDLRNAVMDIIDHDLIKTNLTMYPTITNIIWKNTTPDSKLRQLVLDYYRDCMDRQQAAED